MGGGGFTMEPDNPRLDDFLAAEARRVAEKRRGADAVPRVLFLPTASGDSPTYVEAFADAWGDRAELDAISLFARDGHDLGERVLAADLVFVGGGNTANLIALWRLHGLDRALRDAAAAGVVLSGVSAGALCWFACGLTDSFGPGLAPLGDALGFLPGAYTPHYDGDPARRPRLHALVADGTLPDAWAADDGVALIFDDGELVDAVTSRPGARAYRVTRDGDRAVEAPRDARELP